jgi:hypothetical protein
MHREIYIYEHCNPACSTMLHFTSEPIAVNGRIKGFARMISKLAGDDSDYPFQTWTDLDLPLLYFKECYKLYTNGEPYVSVWKRKEIDYELYFIFDYIKWFICYIFLVTIFSR